jgi:hypothetical protein
MMKYFLTLLMLAGGLLSSLAFAATDVALVTSLAGKVSRLGNSVDAFVKLKQGDQLMLEKDAKIQITYFQNGRQESWTGAGKLEIAGDESKPTGLAAPQIKQVPLVIVKQLARTPALDSQGRAGVTRLRSIPTPDAIAKVERIYQQMRTESTPEDLNPELFLLAGMLELQQLERVEKTLLDLKEKQSNQPEVKMLISLYSRALKDVKAVAH